MPLFFIIFLLVFAFDAQALNSSDEDTSEDINRETSDEKINVDNVTVFASKKHQTIENLSKAVSVVTRDEIAEKNVTLLPDLLREEAGVYIQQTTPGQGIPIIRGLKGSENVHLIDGMRLNTAFFRNSPNQYLALVDSFMTEQIEIIRGPASVLYGGDALGGVLNVVTHTPSFITSGRQFSGVIFSSFDSADEKILSHLSLDYGNDTVATTLGLSYQDSGVRRIGGGRQLPFTRYTAKAFNNKWLFKLSDTKSLVFDMQFLNQPSTPRVDDLIAGFGQTQPDSSLFLFAPNERQFVHLTFNNTSASSFYYNSRYDLSWQKIKDYRIKSAFTSDAITTEQNQSTLLSLQAVFDELILDDIDVVYGLDFYHDTINSAKQKTVDGITSIKTPRFPDNSSMRHLGLFADATKSFINQDITFGLRYSDYAIDLNSPNSAQDVLKLDDLTWHLGWLYHLDSQNKLFSNLGRGFRPPNIFDLGQVGDRPGNRFNIVNTDIKPETVYTLDFGVKHFGATWFVDFALFYSKYYDKIASVETGDVTDSGQFIVQSQNINRVVLYGLESSFKYHVSDNSTINAVINYTWGEESSPLHSEAADRIPPLNGMLGYKLHFNNKWSINPKIVYAASQNRLSARDIRDPRINPNGTGGFASYNFYVNYAPTNNAKLRFGVENIFDKKYREHGSGLEAAGKNYHASFNYQF